MRFYIGVIFTCWTFVLLSQLPTYYDTDSHYSNKVISAQKEFIEFQHIVIEKQDILIQHARKTIVILHAKNVNFYQIALLMFFVVMAGLLVLVLFTELVSYQQYEKLFDWLATIKNKILSFFIKN